MIEFHRIFAKSQPTRALFERSELCRSVGGSAFCKKSVNGIRFSYLYLFLCFYEYSIHFRYTKLKFYTSTIFICFFHTLNKAFLRNPSILRFEVPFCSGHCFLCHCIKIIFCDLNVFKAYWQSHT